MNLAQHRFYKGDFLTRGADDQLRSWYRYTYEAHNGLYDVDVRLEDGFKRYQVDMQPVTEPGPIHLAVEKYFGV